MLLIPGFTMTYFIRHGETDWNAEKRFQGQSDRLLNVIGMDQAEAVARWLAKQGVTFDAVYSSDLLRCVETTEAITTTLKLKHFTRARALREIHCGNWEGLNAGEIEAHYPGKLHEWRSQVDSYVIPGGECVSDVQRRVANFYYETVKKHPDQTILMVSHGAALSALFAEIDALNLVDAWNDPRRRLDNTSVSVVVYDHAQDTHVITLFNSVEHLE